MPRRAQCGGPTPVAAAPRRGLALKLVTGWRYSSRPEVDGGWWIGPVGWELDDVVTLARPVPSKGLLGLWEMSESVERAVRDEVMR